MPGDVLTATLTVASLRQIGGNDIIGTTSEITDADGALVCTTSATLVHREAPMTADDALEPQRLHRHPRRPGAPTPRRAATTTRSTRTRRSRRSVGLPGVIAHGMYTHGAGRPRRRRLDPAAPRWSSLGCKFTNPVVVPAEGGVDVEVAGDRQGRRRRADHAWRSTVTCGGQKVLGMPKAVVRA